MQDQVIDTTGQEDSAAVAKANSPFNVMLFGRLQQDCEYYLGYGGRQKKHLWAGDEAEQIQTMKDLYAGFAVKPDWLDMAGIERYEMQMVHGLEVPAPVAQPSAAPAHFDNTIAGMDARVFLAQARIAEVIYGKDSEECGLLMLEAVQVAESDGRHAYSNELALPGMFKDEPMLFQAWHSGYDACAVMDEMDHCSSCDEAAGDPCPSHG